MHKNENRPSYKKTKVGWIPEGWEESSLGDFTKWGSGGTPSKANDSFWNGDIPWISAISMHTTRFSDSELKITKEGLKAGSRLAPQNSLLLLVRGSMLFKKIPVGIAERDVAFNQDVKSIIPDTKAVSSEYLLCWLLGHEQRLLGMVGGTGIGAGKLDLQELQSMELALPPLPEQEAIAKVLECWDRGIRNLELKIAKKRLIKKGLMQALLSGEKRLPAFKPKDSECRISNSECRIPKDWKTVKLGSLGKTISGGTPETEDSRYWNGGIPWCTPTEFAKLETRFIEKTDRTLSELGLKKSSATILPPNSIIVCTRATVGACAINSVPMATNQGFKSLVPSNQTDCTFIYYVLTTLKNHFIRFSSGSTFLELSKRDFEKTKISLPPLEEQRAIAEVLSAADGEIEALEKKLALWKDQKKFLLNNLVTGTVRLPAFAGK
jgi:type I restriction enzyme S subunit